MPFRPEPSFVYFDLDDTLLDHRQAERSALADVCTRFDHAFAGQSLEHVQHTYHTINAPLWVAYAAGEIDRETLKRLRFERLMTALRIDLDPGVAGAHYMERYAAHWDYSPGAREAFLAIAARLPAGILTNGFAEVQHAKLDRFPELRHRSASIVISEEVGYLKPHPALFAEAATRAGVAPERILYVGDSYGSDIAGSHRAGWQAAWYTRDDATGKREERLRFSDWSVLTDALIGR